MKYWDFQEKRGKSTNLSIKKGFWLVCSKSSWNKQCWKIVCFYTILMLWGVSETGVCPRVWFRLSTFVFKKWLKSIGKHSFSWKAGFCWVAIISFLFYTKKLSKSTSRDPPGRPHFNFFGRWNVTRYKEIVTFSIWGPSGRPADRARAGAFSGTLSRPFFVKPWGDFDVTPQLILTIPF